MKTVFILNAIPYRRQWQTQNDYTFIGNLMSHSLECSLAVNQKLKEGKKGILAKEVGPHSCFFQEQVTEITRGRERKEDGENKIF